MAWKRKDNDNNNNTNVCTKYERPIVAKKKMNKTTKVICAEIFSTWTYSA